MDHCFTVEIKCKPYVKRFLQINFGEPADLKSHPHLQSLIRRSLKKPNKRWDYKHIPESQVAYESIEILISQDDFYRY